MSYGEPIESQIGSQTGTDRFTKKDDPELAKDPIYEAMYGSGSKSDNQKMNDHYYPLKSDQEQRQDS